MVRDGLAAINTAADQITRVRPDVVSGPHLDTYTRSADLAATRLAAADTVLHRIIDRLTAAIVAGMSGREPASTQTERDAAAAEVRRMGIALVDDFNTTVNRSALFAGTNVASAAYARVEGAWIYQGNSVALELEVERAWLVPVSFDGQAIAQGTDAVDVFTALDALAVALEADDTAGIGAGIHALERAFDRVSRAQGRLGAAERAVEAAAARLAVVRLETGTGRSEIEDTDLAEAITRMNEADRAYRAALGAVSPAQRQSFLDYLR